MTEKLKLAGAAVAGIVATLAAGGIAFASIDHRSGPFRGADANHDGQITRAEWMATATTRFDALDTNKDGKLVPDELPKPRRHGHHGPHGEWDRDGDGPRGDGDRGGPPPPPPPGVAPQQQSAAPAPAAVPTPAPQK
ncbi:hypothetical protein AB2M62_08850 [Sphingomonas sp. MMS12-HWE2-04]|uniref:hypothetical protein n=1 Tax=Sphingomonas sp. MMS12-HWE2-04 TaxID=3234199 RepID=UPI00384BCEEA